MSDRFSRAERLLLLSVPVLAVLAFWPGSYSPLGMSKLALVLIPASMLFILEIVRWTAAPAVRRPHVTASAILPIFGAALVIAAIVAPVFWTAFVGQFHRFSGLLAYLVAAAVAYAISTRADRLFLSQLPVVLTAVLVTLAALGVAQWIGVARFATPEAYSPVSGTLGNPNFMSAVLGILFPLAVFVAVRSSARVRPLGWAAILLSVLAMAGTRAVQGPVIAFASSVLLILMWLLPALPFRRRIAVGGAAAALLISALLMGILGWGPLAGLAELDALQVRLWYWEAARRMFDQSPLVGVGLGMYGDLYRRYRPDAATDAFALDSTTDAAHNVPLTMFAEGGLLLGLAYVSLVAVVAMHLIRMVARGGEDRFPVAAVGAAWLAYQAQSLVSIDVPALIFLHFCLAGAVLASRRIADSEATTGAKRRSAMLVGQPTWALVLAGVLALAVVWPLQRGLRADANAGRVAHAAADGDIAAAKAAAATAAALLPWESEYHQVRGKLLIATRDHREALDSYLRAVRRDPYSLAALITAARLADSLGHTSEAVRLYERALTVEPHHPSLRSQVADFYLQHDMAERAVAAILPVVQRKTGDADWWARLARAAEKAGDEDLAVKAYQTVLELKPEDEESKAALGRLGSSTERT